MSEVGDRRCRMRHVPPLQPSAPGKVPTALCQQNRDEGVQRQVAWPEADASPPPRAPAQSRLRPHGSGSSLCEILHLVDFYREQKGKSDPHHPMLVTSPFTTPSNQLNGIPADHTPSPRTCAHRPRGHVSRASTPASPPSRHTRACHRTLRHQAADGLLRDILLRPCRVHLSYRVRKHTPPPTPTEPQSATTLCKRPAPPRSS